MPWPQQREEEHEKDSKGSGLVERWKYPERKPRHGLPFVRRCADTNLVRFRHSREPIGQKTNGECSQGTGLLLVLDASVAREGGRNRRRPRRPTTKFIPHWIVLISKDPAGQQRQRRLRLRYADLMASVLLDSPNKNTRVSCSIPAAFKQTPAGTCGTLYTII